MPTMVLVPLEIVQGMQEHISMLEAKLQSLSPHVCPECADAELKAEHAMRENLARFRLVTGEGFTLASPLPPTSTPT